ncbi:tRNA (adenosine(37)-N6)-threonylcarbamoyltransferase complex ATPase subunit type 1 TsaE [Ectothiorhodospira variabilis]|uniref:tRNA (adenosine(37)-N6)-threonylcarbamoyltransferase complex ATPase subunit type 1 TsaE n=1 Tax=Ectothiorhodospira variabilis TaxID=505694 RepID=UPI001EFB30B9|nr:tRNA (adenosine(37)-N6)-threonylcarbamoyltransferase complex ATPase subunit type 1 TsaE [Ectothiorhodospira variabilis]MCG5494501.1 tRNA (adenosine(37)-N6)-threonylcarbamoyltransferase complex ATPase subunit type 1 TsaE [Ectothiorhodospira variabilis]MCG5498310.1 tRNA (adenosine(37)-N6)-threonylcarbamoyltransferase complex ATPase subunit type 1 TsaE [Ectothiorhodospira variabilis]MCG5503128.1 tRNA (adenosine(37)-N6)-threonylcarbamoyltransferase complex ATPase subunit type 1 TsaE [Ectothiorhod
MMQELPDEQATRAFGARLAATCPLRGLVFLQGDLGAGKTTLVRAFLRALGHVGPVKSPTYTLVEPYEIGGRRILHFDLYRLADPEELEYLGVREDMDDATLNLVEWPSQGEGWLPVPDLVLSLSASGEGRRLELSSGTDAGREWVARILENPPENERLSG